MLYPFLGGVRFNIQHFWDKVDHFRQLGANTFGVEDMYGGGDRDFNDLVIQMNIKTV